MKRLKNSIKYTFLMASLICFSLEAKINCDDKTTQFEINECVNAQYKEADDMLNQHYQEIVRRLKILDEKFPLKNKDPVDGKEEVSLLDRLKQSQRKWIQFRDAECDIVKYGLSGGSILPMVYSQCLTKMTLNRVAELENYTHCADYDFSCPFPNLDNPYLN